jgi:hypothetical protein
LKLLCLNVVFTAILWSLIFKLFSNWTIVFNPPQMEGVVVFNLTKFLRMSLLYSMYLFFTNLQGSNISKWKSIGLQHIYDTEHTWWYFFVYQPRIFIRCWCLISDNNLNHFFFKLHSPIFLKHIFNTSYQLRTELSTCLILTEALLYIFVTDSKYKYILLI